MQRWDNHELILPPSFFLSVLSPASWLKSEEMSRLQSSLRQEKLATAARPNLQGTHPATETRGRQQTSVPLPPPRGASPAARRVCSARIAPGGWQQGAGKGSGWEGQGAAPPGLCSRGGFPRVLPTRSPSFPFSSWAVSRVLPSSLSQLLLALSASPRDGPYLTAEPGKAGKESKVLPAGIRAEQTASVCPLWESVRCAP